MRLNLCSMIYKLYQKPPHTSHQTAATIQMFMQLNKKRVKISTGISVPFKEWDKKKQRCKSLTEPLQAEINKEVNLITGVHKAMTFEKNTMTPKSFKNRIELARKERQKAKNILIEKEVNLEKNLVKWVETFIADCEKGDVWFRINQILNYTKNTTIGNEVPNLVQNVWSLLPQPTPNLCVFEFSLSHRAKEPLRTMTIG